jgi:DNA-binding MarR family transcriptional regulator
MASLGSEPAANEDFIMPTLQQAEALKEFVEELFSITKDLWVARAASRGRHEAEITETEFLALDMLVHGGERPLTVGDIQRHIGVLPAQMSRVIRSLESKGEQPLIQCKINPADKRKVNVELTDAGRAVHTEYRRSKVAGIEVMLQNLSEQDRNELMRILRLIRDSAHKY